MTSKYKNKNRGNSNNKMSYKKSQGEITNNLKTIK